MKVILVFGESGVKNLIMRSSIQQNISVISGEGLIASVAKLYYQSLLVSDKQSSSLQNSTDFMIILYTLYDYAVHTIWSTEAVH